MPEAYMKYARRTKVRVSYDGTASTITEPVTTTEKEAEAEKKKQKKSSRIRRPESNETVKVNGATVTVEEYILGRAVRISKETQKNKVVYID